MKRILLILVLISAQHLFAQKSSLTGVWNASENVGSGLNNNFRFFDDGRFEFHTNEMLCDLRYLGCSGKYSLEQKKLKFVIDTEWVIEGGTKQKSTGSCASDSEIVGGREVKRAAESGLTRTYDFSGISTLIQTFDEREVISIDNKIYWLISHDPNTYK